MKNKVLEVCAFNLQSSINAQLASADRVELCDNPLEGGTTPSFGTIDQVRSHLSIQLYPIIRPRSGNYYYSPAEYKIIKRDIQICRQIGCDGISVGAQKISGEIDKESLKRIVEWAGPMGVTCNRAFDGTPDLFQALEDIIDCGCERVLTSGGASAVMKGLEVLNKLVNQAGDRIIVMPGAGVRSENLNVLVEKTNACEYHSSAREVLPNPLEYHNNNISDYGNVYVSSSEEIEKMVRILHSRPNLEA